MQILQYEVIAMPSLNKRWEKGKKLLISPKYQSKMQNLVIIPFDN